MNTYRLEFNEEQLCFHHTGHNDVPNTHGWFTVFEQCDDEQYNAFTAYIDYYNDNKKFTKNQMLNYAQEFIDFDNRLFNHDLAI